MTTPTTPLPGEELTPAELYDAFGRFPSGVALVAAEVDGITEGLVASSFTVGVSTDPPLVLVAVRNASSTWPRLRAAGHLGVSVLGEQHEAACLQIASSPPGDRFAGLSLVRATYGAVFLTGAPLRMRCLIEAELPAGDHHVVLLRVLGLRLEDDGVPLVRHRSAFRRLATEVDPG